MTDSTSDGDYLNASDLIQYYYCNRKIYFLRVTGVHPVTRRKMNLGNEEQAKESKRMLERNDLFGIPREDVSEITTHKFISSNNFKLKGIIDILLHLRDMKDLEKI